jgi:hypothetical protein
MGRKKLEKLKYNYGVVYQRVRNRAVARLIANHKDEFDELHFEEKIKEGVRPNKVYTRV